MREVSRWRTRFIRVSRSCYLGIKMSGLNNPTARGQNLSQLNTIKLDSDELFSAIGSLQWEQFLNRHHLESAYLEQAVNHYNDLVLAILRQQQRLDRPLVVGINGAQGSGKSTLADWLVTVLSAKTRSL